MTQSSLSALVLAAGLGTRLRPLTWVRAKAAVPVAGLPLVARVLASLSSQDVRDVVINLHHRPETITRIVGDGSAWSLRVRYSWEQPVLGSAGGPRRALPLLVTDPFLIVNADTLTNLDVRALADAHRAGGARVTMAVIPNHAPERYGGVLVGADGAVEGFTGRGDPRPSFHFIGVQVADKAVFADLSDGVPTESVGDVYRQMIAHEPGRLKAFVTTASFRDIGTPRAYLGTCLALARAEGRPEPQAGRCTDVDPTASLARTVLWDRVRVGARCSLTECVVADDVVVPDGVALDRAVVVPSDVCPSGAAVRLEGSLAIAEIG